MPLELVGREVQLRAVGATLDDVAGWPAALVLEGAPGIGKTTVWHTAVSGARARGCQVLTARPAAPEAQLSFATLADLLRDVRPEIVADLPEPQQHAVDGVLLRSRTGTASGARADISSPSGTWDPRTLGAALLGVLSRLADSSPVVLAIDDLQWVDPSSAQVAAFALRRLAVPVALLATARVEAGTDPAGWVQLLPPAEVRRVAVGPLSPGALSGMLVERIGRSFPRPEMTRIHEVSGGNPFYAVELARAAVTRSDGDQDAHPGGTGRIPGALTRLVEDRLAGLAAPVRHALLAVAASPEPTVELVTLALDDEAAPVERLLEGAERAGVLTLEGHRIRFEHPLLAAGVYESASAADRRALHGRLAAVVDDPERRARHLALAAVRADPATVDALDAAAGRARDRGATAAAAELLGLAVGLGADDPGRRARLARHLFDAGDPTRARALLEALLTELPAGTDRARTLRTLAMVRLHDDSYLEAAAHLWQALDEVGEDHGLRAEILVDLPYVLVNLGRIPDAAGLSGDSVSTAERVGDPGLLSEALASAVMIGFLSGNGLDGDALRRALDLEDPGRSTPVMYRASLISGLLQMWTGRLDRSRETMQALRRRCLERGEESDLMFGAFHHVVLECWRGDLAEAQRIAGDTMTRADQLGTDVPRAVALCTRATVAAHAGEADVARSCAGEALEIFRRGSCLAVTVWPMVTLGFLEVSLGRHDAAVATLGPLADAAVAMGYGEPTAAPFAADAVEACIGTGRIDRARALTEQLEEGGRRLDRAWALALGGRCRALLRAAEGDLAGAATAARAALVEHERLPMPLERARTLMVLGQIERRRRRRRAAAEVLREAVAVFDEVGARAWADRARAELVRVGGGSASVGELSPTEQRVADLAATGLTNREVAAAMFISPKTVEANLSRVYDKLGIRSRAELGQRMGGSGG